MVGVASYFMPRPSQVSHQLGSLMDLFTTALEVGGVSHLMPHDRIIDGINLLPLFTNSTLTERLALPPPPPSLLAFN